MIPEADPDRGTIDLDSPEHRRALRRSIATRRRLLGAAMAAGPIIASLKPTPARARLSHASVMGSHALKAAAPGAPGTAPNGTTTSGTTGTGTTGG